MEVSFAHLCDYAAVSQDRKLSVMGIFTAINAPQVPVVHPQMYLAFELELDYAEVGRDFTLEIQIVDEDGHAVWGIKAGGNVQAPTTPKPGEKTNIGQIFAIQNLKFDKYGPYDVNIFINGRPSKRLEFKVTRLSPPAGQQH